MVASSRDGASHRVRWGAYGAALSLGAPAGLWILSRWADPGGPALPFWTLLYVGLGTALVFTGFGVAAGALMDRLAVAATRDGLTGLFNRRFLMETLPRLFAVSVRRREPVAVIMADLDRFKRVNDRHGHQVGDRVLREVANVLLHHARATDVVARYGGEEFVVVCPGADSHTAVRIAERLRGAVADIAEEQLGFPGPQTISLGVAVRAPAAAVDPDRLVRQADEALYQAKASGRNRTVLHGAQGDAGS